MEEKDAELNETNAALVEAETQVSQLKLEMAEMEAAQQKRMDEAVSQQQQSNAQQEHEHRARAQQVST